MKFETFIDTRFGDPTTAIDIGKEYIIHGSAQGRVEFHKIDTKEDIALADS